AISQAPARSPHPAIRIRNVVTAVQPGHFPPVFFLEGRCERRFRSRIAHAFAGEYHDTRDALGGEFAAVPRDAEDRAISDVCIRKAACRQWQDQPPAISETIEP